MKDLLDELQAMTREVGTGALPAGDAHVIKLSRRYGAEVDDVWDAITTPERLARWFLPVTGDLRLGGTYQLEGNAGGEIRVCEPPRHLLITWIMGEPDSAGDSSLVDVALEPAGDGRTTLTLTHTAVFPPEMWDQYGPGAVGVGWDLGLIGLGVHLDGEEIGDPAEFEASPEARAAARASSEAWGGAYQRAGADPEVAQRVTAATSEFYAPEEG